MLTLATLIPTLREEENTINSSIDQKVYGPEEELIKPMADAIAIFDGVIGIEDGKRTLYTTVKGNPAIFSVVDLEQNKLLRSFELTQVGQVWHHRIAPDGTVYIAADGVTKLWSYSPVSKQLEPLTDFPGEASTWALTLDDKGHPYAGTFPDGKVFHYNPETREVRDYGRMIGKGAQEYVRSMAYHDGYIYAGTAHDQIVRLHLGTGEKQDIAADLDETGFVYDMNLVDERYLFVRYSDSKNAYIYDIQQQQWLDVQLPNVSGLHTPQQSYQDQIYFVADGNQLKAYDLNTQEIIHKGLSFSSGMRGADWVEMPDPDLPGLSLATVQFGGAVSFYNPQTHRIKTYPAAVQPAATPIHAIEAGQDGMIYTSGFQGAIGAMYDPATGRNVTYPMGQADVIFALDERTLFGMYTDGAEVRQMFTNQPLGSQNPRVFYTLGENQNRYRVAVEGDGLVFFGTIADYGSLGGAVAIYDTSVLGPNAWRVYPNIVADQSIAGLAYRDGLLYGSTNVRGGLGIDPTASEARMFVWDVEKGEKIKEFSPDIPSIDQPKWIGKLSIGPDDLLWGVTSGTIFALDPDTLETVKSRVIYPEDDQYSMWSSAIMKWSDGLLYVGFGSRLTVIDPHTLESKVITESGDFTIGPDGHLYYTQTNASPTLYRIQISGTNPDE